jgi:hypothetical protein
MAHTFMKNLETAGRVAGAAHTAYQIGKTLWGVGRALAPLLL